MLVWLSSARQANDWNIVNWVINVQLNLQHNQQVVDSSTRQKLWCLINNLVETGGKVLQTVEVEQQLCLNIMSLHGVLLFINKAAKEYILVKL